MSHTDQEQSPAAFTASAGTGTWLPAVAAVALGAGLVMVSGFLVWFRFLGVDLTGFRMARLVNEYDGVIDDVPPGFLGILWYLLPLIGALTWIVLFLKLPLTVRAAHVWLGMTTVITVGVFLGVAARRSDIATGPVVAFLGGVLIVVGAWSGLAREGVGSHT